MDLLEDMPKLNLESCVDEKGLSGAFLNSEGCVRIFEGDFKRIPHPIDIIRFLHMV